MDSLVNAASDFVKTRSQFSGANEGPIQVIKVLNSSLIVTIFGTYLMMNGLEYV